MCECMCVLFQACTFLSCTFTCVLSQDVYFHMCASTRHVHYMTPVSVIHAKYIMEIHCSTVVVPCKIMHVKMKSQLSSATITQLWTQKLSKWNIYMCISIQPVLSSQYDNMSIHYSFNVSYIARMHLSL